MTRASEVTPSPANGDAKASGSVGGDAVKSQEGQGKEVLTDDYDGRLTMQVTGSMHDVGWAFSHAVRADDSEENENGSVVDWRFRRFARRVRDV